MGVSERYRRQGGVCGGDPAARGTYDPAALVAELGPGALKAEKIKDVQTYSDENSAILMPNGNELILLAGPTRDTLPLKEIAGWTHQSKLIFRQDPELMKLVAGIDTTKPLWAAIKMNDCYRQAGVLAAFDTHCGGRHEQKRWGRLFLDITGKGAGRSRRQSIRR